MRAPRLGRGVRRRGAACAAAMLLLARVAQGAPPTAASAGAPAAAASGRAATLEMSAPLDGIGSGDPAPDTAAAEPSKSSPSEARRSSRKVERLDLGQCIRRALDRAPEIEVARTEVVVSQSKLAEAKASRIMPDATAIDYFGLARRARGTVLNPKDTVDVNAYGAFNRVEINVIQPLYTWGKITAGIDAATHAVEAQLAASHGVSDDVIQQVKTLYYNVLLARSVEGVVQEVHDAFGTALKTAQRRREAGDPDVTELGVLYLRVGQSQTAKELPGVTRGAETALEALRRMMGEDPDAPIDLMARRLTPENVKIEPIDVYADRLFTSNPSWKQIDAGVAAKADEVRTLEADFFPSLFLTGSFVYSYAPRRDRQLNPFAYDYFNVLQGPGALLGIRWPLNFHVTAAKANTARAELDRLAAQRRQAQTGLPLELKNAYDKVVDSRTAVEKLEDGRKAGRAILTLAVTNFDVGIGEPREIIEGLGTYSRVTSDYFEAVRDYDLALAALSRVVGEEVTDLKIPSAPIPAEPKKAPPPLVPPLIPGAPPMTPPPDAADTGG